MNTVLVTGGCGYIGSHTCINLLENNYKILIIDSLINSSRNTFSKIKALLDKKGIDFEGKITFIEGDLRNKEWLNQIFLKYSETNNPIKSVIHFAGLKAINSSIKLPLEYWEMNISSTLSLLSVMKKFHCFSIIFSSSATVYKPNGLNLLKEDDLLEPKTPYGKTKLTIENILKDLFMSDKENWKIANLRYFNPVGAHPSGMIGENLNGDVSNLFPSIMRTIKGEQKSLLVFGNDWHTYDGTCIRDFIHVMDLADSHLRSLDFLLKNKSQLITLNIGTGKGHSVLELIKTFEIVNKVKVPFIFSNRREGDSCKLIANISKAKSILNWVPKRSLEDMCISGWSWKSKNPNGYESA